MVRHFVLGNGNILVGLDNHGRIRDFYFPYVGQENHVNGKIHRIGIWVNGMFTWFESDEWKKTISYKKETLITNIVAINERLGIQITFNDGVCHKTNVFIRKIKIQNLHDDTKEVRLFFHQQFDISEGNIGDTVYYHPILKSLIHYKGKRYFLMNGSVKEEGIAEYATGLVGEYGLEGTYKDAEDGVLSNNPIEHGSVDSTLALHLQVPPKKSKDCYYWICVGDCYHDVLKLNETVISHGPSNTLLETEKYWKEWVNKAGFTFMGLSKDVVDLFKRSLLIINTQMDKGGSIIASSDSEMLHLRRDTYAYMWPRDGALISRSLDRAGYSNLTSKFFNFCTKAMAKEGYLLHKYRPDGSLGSSWHSWLYHGHIQLPIQEDETALVLDALWKHYEQHGNKKVMRGYLDSFVRPAAEFMLMFIDERTGLPKETYDLWEEKLGIHTFTVATVYAGFKAAANFEKIFGKKENEQKYLNAAEKVKKALLKYLYDKELGYFIKMVYYEDDELKKDTTLDMSSAYGVFQFGVLDSDDERIESSMNTCMDRLSLKTASGGHARYTNDYYYRIDKEGTPGNAWFITTLWLAEYYIHKAYNKKMLQPALDIFNWVASHALETGVLSEQIHPHNSGPVSVAPLTWSHAGFVIAINKYLEKLDNLGICTMCNPPKLKEK
jgi:oligosaccharide amylase